MTVMKMFVAWMVYALALLVVTTVCLLAKVLHENRQDRLLEQENVN